MPFFIFFTPLRVLKLPFADWAAISLLRTAGARIDSRISAAELYFELGRVRLDAMLVDDLPKLKRSNR